MYKQGSKSKIENIVHFVFMYYKILPNLFIYIRQQFRMCVRVSMFDQGNWVNSRVIWFNKSSIVKLKNNIEISKLLTNLHQDKKEINWETGSYLQFLREK